VLRLYPWSDATVIGELNEEEVKAVGKSVWPRPQAAWGFDAADARNLCVPAAERNLVSSAG
jgi:hypothetical protein